MKFIAKQKKASLHVPDLNIDDCLFDDCLNNNIDIFIYLTKKRKLIDEDYDLQIKKSKTY